MILLYCIIHLVYAQGDATGKGGEIAAGTTTISLPQTSSQPMTSSPSTSVIVSSTSEIRTVSSTSSSSITSQTESPTTTQTKSTTTFTQPALITPTSQTTSSRSESTAGANTGLIIGGCVIGAIILLGIMVFIYRKIRGLDEEDFKIDQQQNPRPFINDRLSAPDYGNTSEYGSRPQYAVYPTVGRPGLPGFVEKGQIVETPELMDTNYYGTPEFGYHPDYYNRYNEGSNQYSNPQLGYHVARPQDSMQGARQY